MNPASASAAQGLGEGSDECEMPRQSPVCPQPNSFKGNVERLDNSWDYIIHTKYRILLICCSYNFSGAGNP